MIKKGLKAIRKKIPGYSYFKGRKKIEVPQHFRTYYVKARKVTRAAKTVGAKAWKHKKILGVVVVPTTITTAKYVKEMKKRGVSPADSVYAVQTYTRRYGKGAYVRKVFRMFKERGEGKSFFDEYAEWVKKWAQPTKRRNELKKEINKLIKAVYPGYRHYAIRFSDRKRQYILSFRDTSVAMDAEDKIKWIKGHPCIREVYRDGRDLFILLKEECY